MVPTVSGTVTDKSGNVATWSQTWQVVSESIPTAPPAGYAVPQNAAAIQASLDGGPTYLTAGDWLLPTSASFLKAGRVFDLMMHPQCVLWRTAAGGNSATGSMFRNKSYAPFVPNDVFKVQGGLIKVKPGCGGSIFTPYSAGILVAYVRVEDWFGGKLWGGGAPDASARFMKFTWACAPYDYAKGVSQPTGSGCAGFRWMCGGGLFQQGGGRSGDDALQFVPSGAPGDPFFNGPDIDNFWYEDSIADSNTARSLTAGCQTATADDGDQSEGMTQSVRNSGWRRITGHAGGSPCNVVNHNSTGVMDTISAIDCDLVQERLPDVPGTSEREDLRGQANEIHVANYAGNGAVRNIDLRGVTVDTTRVPPKGYAGKVGDGIMTNILLPTQ